MAKTATKTAAKPAAAKAPAAATKTSSTSASTDSAKAAATAPAAARTSSAAPKGEATATIKVTKGEGQQGTVDVGVNGRIQKIKVDSEVAVNAATLEALNNSAVEYSTISPLAGEDADEGSSASSTVARTAIRGEEVDPAASDPAQPAHELSQIPDKDIVKQQQGAASDEKPLA